MIGTVKSLFDSHLLQLLYDFNEEKDLLKIKGVILNILYKRKKYLHVKEIS